MTKPLRRSPEATVPNMEATGIETRLRQCAPALPPTLKSRTLENCSVRAEAHRRRQKRLQWQLIGTVAGVLALQWMTLFVVDAQHSYLMDGNSKPPLFASLSFEEINQLWHQRSRQLVQMMEPSAIG